MMISLELVLEEHKDKETGRNLQIIFSILIATKHTQFINTAGTPKSNFYRLFVEIMDLMVCNTDLYTTGERSKII